MNLKRFLKNFVIGQAKDPEDRTVFHRLSLIAFFAWVGLGADGLSSSCYGPEQAYLALGQHTYLSLFVALAAALTVLIISASYSQIIELFPTGGGGYVVASKLLNPTVGMISGCALLIDYVLTIAISIASGADALFSFFPLTWNAYKLFFILMTVLCLTLLNMRGVKESVIPLTPIFLIFVGTHFFVIVYSVFIHVNDFPQMYQSTQLDIQSAYSELGMMGLLFVMMKAYSLGAGTYTGIEAVSNGLPILREPRVETGKKTMQYMSYSLALTVMGLMIAYLLFHVMSLPGKTLNAVLFENLSAHWGAWGHLFVLVTLVSESLLLFVAAQAGFLGGPSVLANMAVDRWFPSKFSSLSDRLVTQNGVMLMGTAAIVTLLLTRGSVNLLVVLYSINVFITFCSSQLGMVRHWWSARETEKKWVKRISINGIGLLLTTFILISVIILKFDQGGWATLATTASLVIVASIIKRHYLHTTKLLHRLNSLVETAALTSNGQLAVKKIPFDPEAKTAIILVNGFNGLGLHTLFNVIRFFGKEFKNFVFIQIGVIDAGNFKGLEEVDRLKEKVKRDIDRYLAYMNQNGFFAEGYWDVGIDHMEEIEKICAQVIRAYPGAVVFAGQLVFPEDTFMTRWLHNYTVFSMQRRFYRQGIPFVILPIRV